MANEFPAPQDNPLNCPVCGLRPCAFDCGLHLTRWDLERFERKLAKSDHLPQPQPWQPPEEDNDAA